MDRDRVRRFIQRRGDPSVPQVLGRFLLDPDQHADEVRQLLQSTNRARDRQGGGSNLTEASRASRGDEEPQETENHHTEAGLLRLLRVNGEINPPSLEIGGGEGGRARVRTGHPEKRGQNGGGLID